MAINSGKRNFGYCKQAMSLKFLFCEFIKMVFNFVISFSMWLLVTLLLLMTTSSNNAVEGIKVIGSTNVSTVHVGQPFTFRCEVTEYELNDYFSIWFYYYITNITNNNFAEYIISGSITLNF